MDKLRVFRSPHPVKSTLKSPNFDGTAHVDILPSYVAVRWKQECHGALTFAYPLCCMAINSHLFQLHKHRVGARSLAWECRGRRGQSVCGPTYFDAMLIHYGPSALRETYRSLNDVVRESNLYTHLPY